MNDEDCAVLAVGLWKLIDERDALVDEVARLKYEVSQLKAALVELRGEKARMKRRLIALQVLHK